MTPPTGSAGRDRLADTEPPERSSEAALGPRPIRLRRLPGLFRDWRDLVTVAIPAFIAYVPLLFTHPGMVGADTKTYLYLDPLKLMKDAPFVWDYQIGLGTVTHQNIGYLFPMGPFYLVLQWLNLPDWVAQRLWMGSVMFAAAMGVRYLLHTLGRTRETDGSDAPVTAPAVTLTRGGLGRVGVLVATLAYMLSPYILDYSARISVILLPWAALPWFIGLAIKSVRNGGWRYPAAFALLVLFVGGINATALIMVGLGPLLWIAHAVWVDKEATGRQALAAMARIGALTLVSSLWWLAGLWAEGRYGLPVLRYTESYRTVAESSNAPEVLRGLGYWFFYGNDKIGPWIEPSVEYTNRIPLLFLSYALPILAFASAALIRWRYRAYFIGLIVVGGLTAVASHPFDEPSFIGSIFKAFTRTDAGLSLRSTPRAVPLVVLATAVFLGAGIDSFARLRPRFNVPIAALACGLIILNFPPIWNSTMVGEHLERPEDIPSYWNEDAAYLQSKGDATRVLEVPGADFAAYRWGNTVDPVLPGLMERPYVARELFTWGSPPSANLVNALDRRFHEDTMDPTALAPIAQLMGAGDINVRNDLQYERYRLARPKPLWDLIRRSPGLDAPTTFGPTYPPNLAGPEQTLQDEVELGMPPGLEDPPRVGAFPVKDPLPILRTETGVQPLLMAGDGEGLVDAAAQGVVNPRQPVFYSGSFAQDQVGFDSVYNNGADLMVTDSNRKRARRWGALRENTGYTEAAGETWPTFDPTDQRLDVFPGATDDAFTVSEQRPAPGSTIGVTATATGYGNPVTYTPDDRPANALDGDALTSWRVGAISTVNGEKLYLNFDKPMTTDRFNVLQPVNLERTRWITRARATFEGAGQPTTSIDVDLGDSSRDPNEVGQDITFPTRTFDKLTLEVLDSNVGDRPQFDGVSGVGFAEVRFPGLKNEELARPPVDLLNRAGASSIDHRLTYLFTRQRSNPAEPVRTDEDVNLRRALDLPTARTFGVGGMARVSAYLADDQIDKLLGLPNHLQGGVTASADVHLPGNLLQRASATIDGDLSTAWTSIYQKQEDKWLNYAMAKPTTFDHVDFDFVADGRHSVPTRIQISVNGEDLGPFDVPPITDHPEQNGTEHVTIPLGRTVTGDTVRVEIKDVRKVETIEWYSGGVTIMPVSIAEITVPGLHLDPVGPTFDSGCRSDLLSIDTIAVPVRVHGSTEDLLNKRSVPVEACAPADVDNPDGSPAPATMYDGTKGVHLNAGPHVVRTGIGRPKNAVQGTGIDIDRLALSSERGGAMLPVDQLPTQVPAAPATTVEDRGRVNARLTVADAKEPFWVVLGESWNPGWNATINGTPLGTPATINGYGNGWYVDPAVIGAGPYTVQLEWSPQNVVWKAIFVSIFGVLLCLGLLFFGVKRQRLSRPLAAEPNRPITPTLGRPWPWPIGAEEPPGVDGSGSNGGSRAVLSVRAALVASIAYGLFVGLDVPVRFGYPVLGLAVGIAFYVALRRKASRSWLGLAGFASFAGAGAYYVIQQLRHRYQANFVWPTLFETVHILGLLAIFLLGAEALRDILIRQNIRVTGDSAGDRLPAAEILDPDRDPEDARD